MRITSEIKESNWPEIEKFVFNHTQGNFFQSSKAFRFFKGIKNCEPLFLVAKNDREIKGSLLAVVVREHGKIKGYFSRRCIVWGGPLVKKDAPETWAGLLDALRHRVSGMAIYTEFRNFEDMSMHKSIFESAGYDYNEHLNFVVHIESLEKARAGLSKSKKRQINKSLKSGAKIVQAENSDQVMSFYRILESLYRNKVKKPLPDFEFFDRFFQDHTLGRFLLVQYEGRIVGGIMCPVYRDTIYEWFVCGIDEETKDVYPSVLATWAPILYAAENKLSYFDFMGAGRPDQDYGVREFKSKFGGRLVNYGRFTMINQKMNYRLGKLGFEILKRIA